MVGASASTMMVVASRARALSRSLQAALIHECVERAAQGEVSLEQAAVQIAALPRGVGKSPVAGLRAALRLASCNLASSPMNAKPLSGGDGGSVAIALSTVADASKRSCCAGRRAD